jgi:eukaryotic-like serine/threonine-protein kinase
MDGERLIAGRYRMLERLGAGGMSVVWRAHDQVLGRDVAVKVLSPELAAEPGLLRRIHAEARAAAGLRHPNVVGVFDYGETEAEAAGRTVPYVVMELVAGRSMTDLLRGGAMPWHSAVLIAAQVAAALAAAHAHGIVHRDVKPGNVMVTAAGVKLVDFGISAAIGEADMTGGELLGTPAYLAPERFDGGQVRPATDVYALGLLLYLALAGRLPWRASTTTQMLRAHRYHEPAALPPVPGLPPEVADLCHRCLSKRPGDRPAAAEVAETLGRVAGLPSTTQLLAGGAPPAPDDATTIVRRRSRQRRSAVAVGAAAVVVVGGVAAWASGRSGDAGHRAVAAPAASPQRAACTVDYAIRSALDGRSSTAVTIRNTGQVPVDAWQLRFTLPEQQTVVRGWTGGWRQTGSEVLARGGALPAGGSVATGFDAAYRDATALPAAFMLNGTACTPVLSVFGQSTPPTTAPTQAPARQAAQARADNSGPGSSNSGEGKAKDKDEEKPGKDKEKNKAGKGKDD